MNKKNKKKSVEETREVRKIGGDEETEDRRSETEGCDCDSSKA
jgi:hypothetical protein